MRTKIILGFLFSALASFVVGGMVSIETGLNPVALIASLFGGSLLIPKIAGVSMVTTCGTIGADILNNCVDSNVPGIDDELIVMNHADVTLTKDANNKIIVTDIALTASPAATAYRFVGQNFNNKAMQELVDMEGVKMYKHTIVFKVNDNNPTIKLAIDNMKYGRFVVLLKNNYENENASPASDSLFELAGAKNGLQLISAVNDKETFNGWILTFGSNERVPEPTPLLTFFDTDKATTATAVAALYS